MKKNTRFKQLLNSSELEFICEADNGLSANIVEEAGLKGTWARTPIMFDGYTGCGNFNNFQRLMRKLEQCYVAAVRPEVKLFHRTDSFFGGRQQPLTDQFIPNYVQNSHRFSCFFTPITDLTTPVAQPDRCMTVAE